MRRIARATGLVVLGATIAWAATSSVGSGAQLGSDDVSALGALVAGFEDDFGRGDAEALAARFDERGTLATRGGPALAGRDRVERRYAGAFRKLLETRPFDTGNGRSVRVMVYPPAHGIRLQIERIQASGPGVARLSGSWEVSGGLLPHGILRPPEKSIRAATGGYHLVAVRQDGRWLVRLLEVDDTAIEASED